MTTKTVGNDSSGDVLGLVAGSGILLFQAAAVIPGLLPVLILTVAFAVPLLLVGAVAALLVAIPYGLWRTGSWAVTSLRSRGAD